MQRNSTLQNIDWITVILYLLLVAAGWMNIYSASLSDTAVSFTNLDNIYAKQLFFIGLSLVLIVFILAVDAKFYERFSSVIYLIALASLLGLFIFGKDINGARSWYSFGSFGLQPSEFAKAAAALALSKYLSDIQTNIKLFNHQLKAFLIILLPALLIVPQPDPWECVNLYCFDLSALQRRFAFHLPTLGLYCCLFVHFNPAHRRLLGSRSRGCNCSFALVQEQKEETQLG